MKKLFTIKDRCVEASLLGCGRTTVLFFHDFGSSAAALPADERLLVQDNLQLLCLNRPGVGGSTMLKKYSVDTVVADAKLILEQLAITRCVVAGWSAGGLYAQAFAQAYPSMVLSLHLISSAIPFANSDAGKLLPGRWKSIRFTARYFPFAAKWMFKNVSKKLRYYPDGVLLQSIEEMMAADKEVALDKQHYSLLRKAAAEGFAHEGYGVFADAYALSRATINYNRISCPVHIWTGEHDNIWPPATAAYLHDRLPQSELHINRYSGHLLYLKSWEKIVAAMNQQPVKSVHSFAP